MGSDTYVVFIQEAQYRWVLALGYPNDLSTGSRSRVLGAFMLIAKTLENHLKWPKQFVFLGQYIFLHFFQHKSMITFYRVIIWKTQIWLALC